MKDEWSLMLLLLAVNNAIAYKHIHRFTTLIVHFSASEVAILWR